jgi:hypothetical protein
MEPLNDNELDDLLRQWHIPLAPETLGEKLLSHGNRLPWWRWLLRGTIRVPVPVGLAGLVLLLGLLFAVSHQQEPRPLSRPMTLADFQPVKQLKPRILRSTYESH